MGINLSDENQLKESIKQILGKTVSNDVQSLQHDQSLSKADVIDSASMIDFITNIEEAFGIRIEAEEINPKNFDSISSISQFIKSKSK